MDKNNNIHRSPGRIYQLAGVLGLLCLALGLFSLAAPAARADGGPGGNVADPAVRAVDIARPAIVRVLTQLNGHVIVHFSAQQTVTFPLAGNGAYQLAALGTGTFISSHGDILTADHVVRPPKDQELTSLLIKSAAPDVAAYYNQTIKPGSNLTAAEVELQLTSGQLANETNFDPPASFVFLSTDYSGPLSAARLRDLPPQLTAPVDRIEKESPVDQSDVAIIHANLTDMASVQLGDSSTVQAQDNLTIIGFPGNADVSIRPTDFLTSSINRIFVSSVKTTDNGAQVIQVGGNVEQGDSGGPALDTQGRVVGVVSFGTPGGTSFLQASNSARTLLQGLNLDTTPGSFQRAWSLAFNDYSSSAQGHWHKAQQELQSLATRYPFFKGITTYLTYAQQQARNEKAPQTTTNTTTPAVLGTSSQTLVIGGAVIVVLFLLIIIGVFMARGRRKNQRLATANGNLPYGGQPGQNPAQLQAQPFVNYGQSYAQQSQQPQQPAPVYRQPQQPIPGQVYAPSQQPQPQPSGYPGSTDAHLHAFGAPPVPVNNQNMPAPGFALGANNSGILRPWPCGHMNRSNARYCSICGEPSPPAPTVRRVEQ